jgi:hypothetical protein
MFSTGCEILAAETVPRLSHSLIQFSFSSYLFIGQELRSSSGLSSERRVLAQSSSKPTLRTGASWLGASSGVL